MKKYSYYIITIGCQMNKSDSERIAGYLEKHGFIWSQDKNRADFLIITTCGVRQSAEDRVYGIIPKLKKINPRVKIILTGCLSQREDVKKRLKKYVDIWMPITELESLACKLGLEKSESNSLSGYLAINPKYNSKFSAFVPIGNGCDNFCAYCVVPNARGREVYRDAQEILDEVDNLVKKGYKEIILIAQNVNSYVSNNKEHKTKNKKQYDFSELLRMVDNIEGDFWIRFATSHPKDMSNELIKAVAKFDKVCEHIHLPVQSGDNEVLRRMNRNYTRERYIDLIQRIKSQIAVNQTTPSPSLSKEGSSLKDSRLTWQLPVAITTDIIVGFPGEIKKQFNQTAKLFREIKFDMAYIAQYSPRPGTAAVKFEDAVSRKEKKRREEKLMKILRKTALANNKKYVGEIVDVLIEGKNKRGELYGKTRTYKHVTCNPPIRRAGMKHETDFMGRFVKVKINKVKDFGLEGEIVE